MTASPASPVVIVRVTDRRRVRPDHVNVVCATDPGDKIEHFVRRGLDVLDEFVKS
jgi:hypothetical protein